MIAKISSNLGLTLLAVMALVALSFPTPEDAKDALTRAISKAPEAPAQIDPAPQALVQIEPSSATAGAVVVYDPAGNCLTNTLPSDPTQLRHCANAIYEQLVAVRLVEMLGKDPIPVAFTGHDYEAQRLSLSKLCRTLWRSEGGNDTIFENPACSYTVAGVEPSTVLK